eukprot:gnl/MRDRNA2_/MRDRNA2_86724_c0_seq4.p3 gnl/MRDRNA2_/MRDRNA2_86724_c0~~gnl/MRDRNA2_/MRDRNA2_86724_c0_seq4.p3  ORF type:complete len:119 (-),score=3.02 gnl/MRDRNA2_/MRDRNA2_86724_c0_seq4:592-948(-)
MRYHLNEKTRGGKFFLNPSFQYTDIIRKRLVNSAALENSAFEPDIQVAIAGATLGIVIGIGAPIFYTTRDEVDEKRLQEIRALNRATKEATGEYMNEQELYTIRPPRWTDRREFLDDD